MEQSLMISALDEIILYSLINKPSSSITSLIYAKHKSIISNTVSSNCDPSKVAACKHQPAIALHNCMPLKSSHVPVI